MINFEFGITDGKVLTNMSAGSREKARTHKLQIITLSKAAPSDKQLNLALTKQQLPLEHRS